MAAALEECETFGGGGHERACEARPRLAHVERLHRGRLGGREVGGEPREAGSAGRFDRIELEACAEVGIDEQTLEEMVRFGVAHDVLAARR